MKKAGTQISPDLRIYTAPEVCEILKIGQRTLYRYIADGKINGFRVGRNYRFTEEDLKDYMERTKGKRPYKKRDTEYWDAFDK